MRESQNLQQGLVRTRVVIVTIFVLAVLGVVGYFALRQPSSKDAQTGGTPAYQQVAGQFFTAMSKNDSHTTWGMMTSRYQLLIGPEDAWKKQVNEAFGTSTGTPTFVSAGKQSDPKNTYKNQDPHRVTYLFTLKDGKWSSTVIMLNINGTWKVDELESQAQ
ncbi:MAG TPA: hypothetical protein VLG11_06330 [Candidatus Saccharimonadales bacterium]|nr:hypothetical protein [Candidatus Saccharimonadales bacterium]